MRGDSTNFSVLLNERPLLAEAASKRKIDRVRSFPSQVNFQLKSVAY